MGNAELGNLSSPLMLRSNVTPYREGVLDADLLAALPGDQLRLWLQTYPRQPLNPFPGMESWNRPLEDNEGIDEAEREALAAEARSCGFKYLPPRVLSRYPIPGVRQTIEQVVLNRIF